MNKLIKKSFERITQKVAVSALCVVFAGSFYSCMNRAEADEDGEVPKKISTQNLYYVVGFDGSSKVDIQKGTVKSGGYLLISEEYKDLLLDKNLFDNISLGKLDDIVLLVNLIVDEYGNRIPDPFDDIIDFPAESMPTEGYCGYRLFPEKYRFASPKVQMTYRPMTEEEERYVPRMTNDMCYNPLYFHIKFNCIVITSISKIQ